LVLEPNPRSKA
jgi:hypothetical protein